ncbi:hypothetical protein [Naasia sp. SYSU D00948]|uniref:hypothetical protein n=1 Tax=Naasia sp. SYSU D00948 TaxID=2817379 RepID=UPI001B30E621|nr:hypothetical protein [Naasia sp. SYSU D00948]
MPSDPLSAAEFGGAGRAPRSFDAAMIAAVRRAEEPPAEEPPAEQEATVTGPQYWARARVPRPPTTRSRTGITVSPYIPAPEEQIGSPEILRSLRLAAPGLIRTANEILDVEGPMPLQRLITLTARRFGIPRLDPQRRYHMARVVGPQFRVLDDFAWPNGVKPATWRGARRVGDPNDRRIVDISREELQNAMEFVLGDVAELIRGELVTQAAALLGYPRIPVPARPWVDEALDAGIASGRFLLSDGAVRLA